jgi:hypothetical protein
MAGARRYRFVGAWGLAQIMVGCLVILVASLAAFAVLSPWPADFVTSVPAEWRTRLAPAAIAGLLLAIVLGGSLVVSGQMLLLLRDIHRHAARLDRRDRHRRHDSGRAADRQDATSRLIPRR